MIHDNEQEHSSTADWRGNIVFYFSYGDSWWEKLCTRLVAWATHGPYVHCEIVYGQNIPDKKGIKLFPNEEDRRWITIGAHSDGIKFGLLPHHAGDDDTHRVWRMAQIQTVGTDEQGKTIALEPERLAYALEWAKLHLDVSYGIADIVDQILDFVFPWNKVHVAEPDHFDCSNFAVAFMIEAGIRLPRSFTFPFNVSPNDLAEWFGYLPSRKRVKI